MKIQLEHFTFKLSKAQTNVVDLLMEDNTRYIIPKPYYNHQTMMGVGDYGKDFKKPTIEWLKDRNILIPTEDGKYLRLNNLTQKL